MSNSGEESPDWLRSFQVPPTHSGETLSSGSGSSHNGGLSVEEKTDCQESSPPKSSNLPSEDESLGKILKESVAASSSSKRLKRKSPKKGKEVEDPIPLQKKKLDKSMKIEGNSEDVEVAEGEPSGKHIEPHVSSSTLPLVLSEKVQRSKVLLECEGDSIDLSGDMGAVGRVIISDPKYSNPEMHLDLKGTVYETTIVPSRTFCVVSFGQSEAKIEAIMNDFVQLKPRSNVYEAETMLEDDEGDKLPKPTTHQTDQNEDGEEQTKGNGKAKAEKTLKVVRKRGKTAGGKPQPAKKAKKKTQVSKKSKNKK